MRQAAKPIETGFVTLLIGFSIGRKRKKEFIMESD